jgi:hypothetical protein
MKTPNLKELCQAVADARDNDTYHATLRALEEALEIEGVDLIGGSTADTILAAIAEAVESGRREGLERAAKMAAESASVASREGLFSESEWLQQLGHDIERTT